MLMLKDEKWIESISQIVREAGRLILNLQTKAYAVLEKGAANYVTAIDLAVQSYILAELKQRTPDFAVMAEESDVNQTSFAKPTWILDPVDGTTNAELARYTLQGGMPFTGMVMAKVYRQGSEWKLQAIGEGIQAKHPGEAAPQLVRFLAT